MFDWSGAHSTAPRPRSAAAPWPSTICAIQPSLVLFLIPCFPLLLHTCPAGNGGTFLYNTYTGQWKQGVPRPYAGHHIAAEVINNRLYLFGGLNAGGNKVRQTVAG